MTNLPNNPEGTFEKKKFVKSIRIRILDNV